MGERVDRYLPRNPCRWRGQYARTRRATELVVGMPDHAPLSDQHRRRAGRGHHRRWCRDGRGVAGTREGAPDVASRLICPDALAEFRLTGAKSVTLTMTLHRHSV